MPFLVGVCIIKLCHCMPRAEVRYTLGVWCTLRYCDKNKAGERIRDADGQRSKEECRIAMATSKTFGDGLPANEIPASNTNRGWSAAV